MKVVLHLVMAIDDLFALRIAPLVGEAWGIPIIENKDGVGD